MTHILAIDQGTTSSRAIVFDAGLKPGRHRAGRSFAQHFPTSGWVEHDPEEIWRRRSPPPARRWTRSAPATIAAIGITNQRETTVVWDRETGKPIHNAIVWQDRRTAETCAALQGRRARGRWSPRAPGCCSTPISPPPRSNGCSTTSTARATAAEAGKLAFGTIDSFLIWRLTGGQVHVTDATNAARTMLYDIRHGQWDDEICAALGVPMSLLPEVRDSAADFGATDPPVRRARSRSSGVAGDQQAATVGQACFDPA